MQDTSIKGNGTSRFVKGASNFPSSFEEFRRQIMAGTLTADIGLNPAGCDVVGTALSKANLLTDEVANQLGLAGTKTVNEALSKLFTFADDGKKACASAVSAMGVHTDPTASFDTIAQNIRSIKTGSDVSGVTATESDVRAGMFFVNKTGNKLEGNLVSRSKSDITTQNGSTQVSIRSGIYDKNETVNVKDTNLDINNICKNVTIFGKTGTLVPTRATTTNIVNSRDGNLDIFSSTITLTPYVFPYENSNFNLEYVAIALNGYVPSKGTNTLLYIDCANMHCVVYGNSSDGVTYDDDAEQVVSTNRWEYSPRTGKLIIEIPSILSELVGEKQYKVSIGYSFYGDLK